MSKITFGEIPGFPKGATFSSYKELNGAGVHRSAMGGISGQAAVGADSIVISGGGYADDEDRGSEIIYTGQGGRDPSSGRHVKDQEMVLGNKALVTSQLEGHPVRVIRGEYRGNPHAPAKGYRYDGLFRVESHWRETGRSGFRIWRFRLVGVGESLSRESDEPAALSGGVTSPGKVRTNVLRVIRDTKQARAVKRHYDFCCQVCGIVIETVGKRYAEAAHVRALGAPHNGPDVPSNLLCLCPNHHVMFDIGAFSVREDMSLIGLEGVLTVKAGHQLDPDCVAYHRARFWKE